MHASTSRRFATVACTAGASLLALGLLAPGAQAADTGPTPYGGAEDELKNPKCSDVQAGLVHFKINAQPVDGSYVDLGLPDDDVEVLPEGAVLPDGFTIVIDDVDTSGEHATFDWEAFVADGDDEGTDPDPFGIVLVQVKASDGGNRYTYDPAAVADTGMLSPMDSISHVDFCFPAPATEVGGGDDGGTTGSTGGTGSTGTTGDTDVAATTGGTDPDPSASIDETVQDPSEVEGELFVDPAPTLPRTGTDDYSLALAGVALLLIGGTTLLGRRVVLLGT